MSEKSAYEKGCKTMWETMRFLINAPVSTIEEIFGADIFARPEGTDKYLKTISWQTAINKISEWKGEKSTSGNVIAVPGDVLECINEQSRLYRERILVLRSVPSKVTGYCPFIESSIVTIRGDLKHWKLVAHFSEVSNIYREMSNPDMITLEAEDKEEEKE